MSLWFLLFFPNFVGEAICDEKDDRSDHADDNNSDLAHERASDKRATIVSSLIDQRVTARCFSVADERRVSCGKQP